jgi:hypothetical protein
MENDSMADREEAYHNAAIDGETPETRDPQQYRLGSKPWTSIIRRFTFRSRRKFLASRNTTSAQARSEHPPGRAGFTWWSRNT